MVAEDEHALICDLAETYGIYDYHKLPARTVAILATGLREDSRIFQKMAKMPANRTTILLASIADRIGILNASLTGAKEPDSIIDAIFGTESKKSKNNVMGFNSPEEFERARYGK